MHKRNKKLLLEIEADRFVGSLRQDYFSTADKDTNELIRRILIDKDKEAIKEYFDKVSIDVAIRNRSLIESKNFVDLVYDALNRE